MRAVIPNDSVSILAGFNGYLEHLRFCQESFELPIEPSEMDECMIDIRLGGNNNGFSGLTINNYGNSEDDLAFKMNPTAEY